MLTRRSICRSCPCASSRKSRAEALPSIWWNWPTSRTALMSCWILRPARVESPLSSPAMTPCSCLNHCSSRSSLRTRVSSFSPEKKAASSPMRSAQSDLRPSHLSSLPPSSALSSLPTASSSCAVWTSAINTASGCTPAVAASRSRFCCPLACSISHLSSAFAVRRVLRRAPQLSSTYSPVRVPSVRRPLSSPSLSSSPAACRELTSLTRRASIVLPRAAIAAL
mmetsp:Transcript_3783/g.9722  ORF Transcript_3783/g.9722 Transcript_3783/m.9722 type:complete len:224 (+) Transcript_3783:567-1238(+)